MSKSANKKLVSTPEVVPMMSKITEDKLIGPNYLHWSQTVHLYLRSICMASHLTEDPPTKIRRTDGRRMMLVSFSKYVIPFMVKYLLSLIIVRLLRS